MLFLERLAEERIREAQANGELDNLPGAGKPLPEEADLAGVAPSLRMACRILKNAGYVPEEVLLRREIADIRQLLQAGLVGEEHSAEVRRRLLVLSERLGQLRGGNLLLQEQYFARMMARWDAEDKKRPAGSGSNASYARKEV